MHKTTSIDISAFERPLYHLTQRSPLERIVSQGAVTCTATVTSSGVYDRLGDANTAKSREKYVLPVPIGKPLGSFVVLTPGTKTPAIYGLVTGFGVERVRNIDLVFLRTTANKLMESMVAFAVADRMPLARGALFTAGPAGLSSVDWDLAASADFRARADDPGRISRAAAEVLAHGQIPLGSVVT